MTTNTAPLSGRLLIRQLGCQGACIVGVLNFAQDVQIQEGAMYLLSVRNGHVMAHMHALDEGIDTNYIFAGVGDLLRCPIWRGTSTEGVVAVRFFKAFPNTNGWSVFGAGQHEFPLQADDAGHAWIDVDGGQYLAIDDPAPARGEAIGSMLSSFAVWPNAAGKLYSLPSLHSQVRPHFERNSALLASLGRGEISADEYIQTVRNDSDLRETAPYGNPDMEYARFVARMHARGMAGATEPQPAEQFARRAAVAKECIANPLQAAA